MAEDFDRTIVKQVALDRITRMWNFRRQYDQRRSGFYRQYVGQRDPMKFPDNVTNRANTFVPYALSNVETITSRVMDAFFSFEPWFEADGLTEQDDQSAEAMSLVLLKKLEMARIKDAFESLVRTILIYGHGGMKVDWDWNTVAMIKPVIHFAMDKQGQMIPDPQTGQPIPIGTSMQNFTVPVCRPRVTPIDIYDLMIDPDGGIICQMTERTIGEMLRENDAAAQATGSPLYYPEVLNEIAQKLQTAHPDDWQVIIVRFAEIWDKYQETCTLITFGDDRDAISWKDLRANYRGATYSSYKRKIYEGRDLLWHGPNQFAHKKNPIVHTSYVKLPNEVYGIGAIEMVSDLNESLNKMVNMVTDNWNLGINRRFAYDTNADIDHDALNLMNVPGGKVPVNGNPNDVIAPLPLFTPNQGDYAILDLYKGMIQMTSGVSDFYQQGVGGSGGNDTATGISSVINESNFRFKMFIRNLEVDILQPLLYMCASMVQQFMTDPEEVLLTKSPTPEIPKWGVVSPEALIGNYEFNLVAANYATSKSVRQRNLMSFAQLAMNSPYWRQGEGLREIGKVLEVRNINDLLKSDQEVQMEQAQAQQSAQQEAFMQEALQTEAKVHINTEHEKAKAEFNPKDGPSSGDKSTAHPRVRHARHGGITYKPHSPVDRGGRPLSANLDSQVPGAGTTSDAKGVGQMQGANATGNIGMGEAPPANG